jgi:hypothetical protein
MCGMTTSSMAGDGQNEMARSAQEKKPSFEFKPDVVSNPHFSSLSDKRLPASDARVR